MKAVMERIAEYHQPWQDCGDGIESREIVQLYDGGEDRLKLMVTTQYRTKGNIIDAGNKQELWLDRESLLGIMLLLRQERTDDSP